MASTAASARPRSERGTIFYPGNSAVGGSFGRLSAAPPAGL
jgi:hypothetical protein